MDFGACEQAFLSRWQQLQIREKTEPSARSRCDILRSLTAQLQYARATNILTADAAAPLVQQFAENYSCIVDIPQEEGGVDNYAENALALTAGRRNESKAWSTSLNKDNVMQLDCVKAFIKDSKLARGMHFPEGRDKEVLPLHNRPAPVSMQATPCSEKLVSNKSSSHPLFKQQTQDPQHTSRNQDRPTSRTKQFDGASILTHPAAPSMAGPGGNPIPHPMDTRFGSRPRGGEQFGPSSSGGVKQRWERSEATVAPPGGYNQNTSRGQHQNNPVQQKPYGVFGSEKAPSLYKKPVKRPCQDFDDEEEEYQSAPVVRAFKTAGEQLAINNQKKYGGGRGGGQNNNGGSVSSGAYGNQKRSLGTRRGLNAKFVPPIIKDENDDCGNLMQRGGTNRSDANSEEPVDERLKNIEPKMIELINSEIMDHGPEVLWTDIAGLEFAKKTIKEIVVWPMLRPDIFTGLRGPPKGLLLFGPPGTGKTLIGKCIASQSKSTFFSISASSLTSKWVGEGEKMVRALFAVARVQQPSVVFIDEIDSLLSQRSDGENEGSRRIKTEFLVQLDGAGTSSEDRILVVGATNRPQEIDEAARRRFVKRLYIPLPESAARRHIVVTLMATQENQLTDGEIDNIGQDTDGYSGADMANLCREAALGPIRSVPFEDIENIAAEQVRPIVYSDFQEAIEHVRPSVSQKDLETYLDWNKQYGSWSKG